MAVGDCEHIFAGTDTFLSEVEWCLLELSQTNGVGTCRFSLANHEAWGGGFFPTVTIEIEVDGVVAYTETWDPLGSIGDVREFTANLGEVGGGDHEVCITGSSPDRYFFTEAAVGDELRRMRLQGTLPQTEGVPIPTTMDELEWQLTV